MGLSDLFIRRPVFAIIINAILVLLGLYGLTSLSVRDLPAFAIPTVTITTVLPGAPPELMETAVSGRIEQAVAALDGVDTITSTSTSGLSMVTVSLKADSPITSPDAAVRAKLDLVRAELPIGTQDPRVEQISTDGFPILYLSLNSANRSPLELTELFETVIRTPLAGLEGVADISLLGKREYAIRVRLDPVRLAAHGVTPAEVQAALVRNNAQIPTGDINLGGRRIPVTASTGLDRVPDFAAIIVRSTDDGLVRLGEVAQVAVEADNADTGVLIDGKPGLAIGVVRQAAANSLTVAQSVIGTLPTLRRSLPSDVTLDVSFDSTIFIAQSVEEVFATLRDAMILVTIVIFLFLGSLRASLVTLITIPVALIGTLAFMVVAGYSLNTFSLLGIVLAVGLVVDDAIVDVENVQRHIARGLDPMTASFIGSREIGFAVMATTLTLASVYLPIGFLPGLVGKLFQEFAFTLAAAVLLSGFISRTLSPMMCSRLLRPAKPRRPGGFNPMATLERQYERWLNAALDQRIVVFAVLIGVAILAIGAAGGIPGKMAPEEDHGYLLVQFTGPAGAAYPTLAAKGTEIADVLQAIPERRNSLVLLGMPDERSGFAVLVLRPHQGDDRSTEDVAADLAPRLRAIPGLKANLLDPGVLSGGGQLPVRMVVRSTGDYRDLEAVMNRILDKTRLIPGLDDPAVTLAFDSPRLSVAIDRDGAGDLSIDASSIGSAIGTAIGRFKVSSFIHGTSSYNIIMDLADGVDPVTALGLIGVRDGHGDVIPLERLVDISRDVGAARLEHFGGQRSAMLTAGLAPGFAQAPMLDAVEKIARAELTPGMSIDWDGTARQLKQSNATAGLVFLLSLVFIYGFLAAQFESFRDPLIVLLVVPFAVFGALLALRATGDSLSLYSGIGMITLIGLIAKQGILVTEFANQLREEGWQLRQAVVTASVTRLRPILMTAAAMVLGAMPLIYNGGAGANGRREIGVVIVGGMIIGTLLALFVVPAAYSLMSRKVRPPLAVPPTDEEARAALHGQFSPPGH